MGNELTVRQEAQSPANFSLTEIEKMATVIAGSQLFGIKDVKGAFALMLIAQAEGRHPATVAMDYDIIQGKTALKSQAALRRFQESGGRVEWHKRTDSEVTATYTHPKGSPVTITWTADRARAMGYDKKDNWIKQPMVMLTWRNAAEGIRLCYAACLSGAYLDTEVRDFTNAPVDTAAVVSDVTVEPEAPKNEGKQSSTVTNLTVSQHPQLDRYQNFKLTAHANGNGAMFDKESDNYLRDTLGKALDECSEAELLAMNEHIKAFFAARNKKAA